MANKQPGDQPYNIILAGKCGVGKRALFERIKERHTVVEEGPTAKHFDMIQHAAACNGSEVMVRLWGTGKMEQHGVNAMTKSYFRQRIGEILVYNTKDLGSLIDLQEWIQISQQVRTWNGLVFAVWGNESSGLEERSATVDSEAVRQLIEPTGIHVDEDLYCTVNSETGESVLESYQKIIAAIHAKFSQTKSGGSPATADRSIQVQDKEQPAKWYSNCSC